MDAVEKAVRNALEKGDAADPAFRQRVYESAAAALDRAIAAKPDLSADAAERRRAQLADRIADIETEFVPATSPGLEAATYPRPDETPPVVEDNERPAEQPGSPEEPVPPDIEPVRTEAPPVENIEPAAEASASEPALHVNDLRPVDDRAHDVPVSDDDGIASVGDDFIPQAETREAPAAADPVLGDIGGVDETYRREPAPRGRKTAIRLVAALLVIAALAIGAWWLMQGGSPSAKDSGDGTLAPVASNDGGSAEPEPGAIKAGENWVNVFSPADPTRVTAPAGASAASKTEGDMRFLRIRAGETDAPFVFEVGQGILETLAGNRAVFRIVARSPGGSEIQMAVACDFGAFGDCGRKRYAVGPTSADYLLETDFPDKNPAKGGMISVTPDIGGGGKAIDIFAIQASVAR